MSIRNLVNNSQNSRNQRFGNLSSAGTLALRYLNTSPAIGATFIDIASMSAPRTIVDITNRGFDAGAETAIREGSGTANHALIGAYGLLASTLLSCGFNNKFGVKSNRVFTNIENIDTLGSIWQEVVSSSKGKSPTELRNIFYKNVLNSLQGLAQNTKGNLEYVSIDKSSVSTAISELKKFVGKNPNAYNLPEKLHNHIKTILTYSTSAESNYILKNAGNTVSSDLDTILKSTFSLGKIFSEPKALKEFEQTASISSNKFIKALKSNKLHSSLVGVALGMAIGASIQPFNVWLTKKRTGKDGFVGVEGEKQDVSLKFKSLKIGSALAFLGFAYSTIVDNVFKTPFKKQVGQFLNRMQFNGVIPSIPQFKAIYGFTIASRLIAARDKNELRESATKDFLGYTNWLILGDFVQKIVATFSNKNLTNYDEHKHGKGFFKKIFNLKVKVKTHDEILFEELKKSKISNSSLVGIDGKMLSSKELIKKFYNVLPDLKSRIRGRNIAQISGYLYSAIVLGILIPKINIAITNRIQEKKNKHKNKNSDFLFSVNKNNLK